MAFVWGEGMSGGEVAGWLVGAAGLIAAIGAAYDRFVKRRDETEKTKQVIRDAVAAHLERIADRLHKDIELRDAHNAELVAAAEQQHEEGKRCELMNEYLYGCLERFNDWARGVKRAIRSGHNDIDDPPDMPERPKAPDPDAANFRIKTLRQNTRLLEESGSHVFPKPGDVDAAVRDAAEQEKKSGGTK